MISPGPKPDCYGFYSELFFRIFFWPSLWLNFLAVKTETKISGLTLDFFLRLSKAGNDYFL